MKGFREDLYHRISVVTVSLPPLRDHQGDILLLADDFLQRFSRELKKGFGIFFTAGQTWHCRKIAGHHSHISLATQPPNLRHFALVTRASRFMAWSPFLSASSIRFCSPTLWSTYGGTCTRKSARMLGAP